MKSIEQSMLDKAIAKEPELIDKGTDLGQVQACLNWLGTKTITNKINRKIGNSYHLKHDVEAWAKEYISNSSFIAAVLIAGVPYRKYPGYPNIEVGIE
jgi:hypothetical protein